MRISHSNRPAVFITMGDPAGIGPEIIAKATASPEIRGLAVFVIVGDAEVMRQAFESAAGDDTLCVYTSAKAGGTVSFDETRVNVYDPGDALPMSLAGKPTREGARKALKCIETAVSLVRSLDAGSTAAIVTAPVDKKLISNIQPGFTGHTEFLQKLFSARMTTMALIGNTLCVIPVTRHIPIKDVAKMLSISLIYQTLEQVIDSRLLISGKREAKIGVCGLNPHCGEGGKIGREEIDVIIPAVEKAKNLYPNITGPLSADVAFYKAMKKEIDIVVSMYHDQGLGPFKTVDFDNGVNMTLGLGHVRTSPDHGTAFDIAGRGIASAESMKNAIRLAVRALAA